MKSLLLCLVLLAPTLSAQETTVWRFDSVSRIGGHPIIVLGTPKVVSTDLGKAVHFEGASDAGDALFLDTLPLTGALAYSFEVIFRPSSKGHPEQRFFHLQEAEHAESRRMFEIRIHDDKWCIDTVAVNAAPEGPARSGIMLNCDSDHLFPVDRWYAVTTTYDGKVLRTYVDGKLQGETEVALLPLGKGGTSVGTRYTKRDFFTGDIFEARFSRKALTADQFLKVPKK